MRDLQRQPTRPSLRVNLPRIVCLLSICMLPMVARGAIQDTTQSPIVTASHLPLGPARATTDELVPNGSVSSAESFPAAPSSVDASFHPELVPHRISSLQPLEPGRLESLVERNAQVVSEVAPKSDDRCEEKGSGNKGSGNKGSGRSGERFSSRPWAGQLRMQSSSNRCQKHLNPKTVIWSFYEPRGFPLHPKVNQLSMSRGLRCRLRLKTRLRKHPHRKSPRKHPHRTSPRRRRLRKPTSRFATAQLTVTGRSPTTR